MVSSQVLPATNGSDSVASSSLNDNGNTLDSSNRSDRFRSWNIFRRGSAETFDSASTMVEVNSSLDAVGNANKEVKEESMVEIMNEIESKTTDENEIENGAGGGSAVGMDMRGERPEGVETYKVVASLV